MGKKFQFLGDGWELQGEVFWGSKISLSHTVCILWSQGWMVAPCPRFSSSLCMWNPFPCIPIYVWIAQFRVCNQRCWRTCGGGATSPWSRWCSRRTSPPPPARPPYYIYYDQESGILQSTCSTILCCFLLKDHQFDLRFSTVWCYGKYLLNLQPPTTLHWVKDYLNENFLFQMIHKVIEKIWSWSRKCWANI